MNTAEEFPAQAAPQQAAPVQQPAPAPPPAQSLPAINDPRRRRPFLAGLLSIVPGLGQVYVGYYKRGFINAITVAVLITVTTLVENLIPLVAIFLGFFWFYNIIDASRRASLYNQALAGGARVELPEDFETPGLKGSLAGGTVLILIGLLLLSNTLFGLSLAWLEQWWPLAVVAFGGYLVYKAMQESSGGDSGSLE